MSRTQDKEGDIERFAYFPERRFPIWNKQLEIEQIYQLGKQ